MAIYVYPPVSLSITSGPTSFVRDGATVTVMKDTLTPGNSRPLPTEILDSTGLPVDFATGAKQTLGNASLSSIDLKTPSLVNGRVPVASVDQVQTGSFDEDLTVTTTPETFIAPAGAFGCFIETKDSNPSNVRVKMGGVASPTSGIQFQAGRSEFYQGGSNVSYCNESGSVGEISIQWFIKL